MDLKFLNQSFEMEHADGMTYSKTTHVLMARQSVWSGIFVKTYANTVLLKVNYTSILGNLWKPNLKLA